MMNAYPNRFAECQGVRYEMCLKARGRNFRRCTLPAGHKGGHGYLAFRPVDQQKGLIAEYVARTAAPESK